MNRFFSEIPIPDNMALKKVSEHFTGIIIEVYDKQTDVDLESEFHVLPVDILLAKVSVSHCISSHFLVQPGQFDREDPEAQFNGIFFKLPYFFLYSKPFNIGIDRAWNKNTCKRLVQAAFKEKEDAIHHGWRFDPKKVAFLQNDS